MFGVHTDHSYHAFAMDDLALVAHLLYRRTDFHCATSNPLFVPVSDSPTVKVVRRELHQNTIARKNANKMLAHLA
jgi:hypothetical protein